MLNAPPSPAPEFLENVESYITPDTELRDIAPP